MEKANPLKGWDTRHGTRIYGVGFDWVAVELLTVPDDPQRFAAEVYEFCPDVVDQGVGDLAELAAEIQRSHTVHLWWD